METAGTATPFVTQHERRDCTLVVVGAGASFDCIPNAPEAAYEVSFPGLGARPFGEVRPPMTQGLVDRNAFVNDVLTGWSWARPVVDYLRREIADERDEMSEAVTLEKALATYQAEQRFPEKERHLLAFSFFVRELLWRSTSYMGSSSLTGGITNYHALTRHLLDWAHGGERCVVFMSMNYDLLLEEALESLVKFDASDRGSYLRHEKVSVVKPHGSVQWEWQAKSGEEASMKDPTFFGRQCVEEALAHGLDRDRLLTRSHGPHESQPHVYGPLATPAMALPIYGKSDFLWPPEQRQRIDSMQGAVSRLIIIGWRALDAHVVDLLAKLVRETAKVLVVTGGANAESEAAHISDRVCSAIRVPPSAVARYVDGFSGVVKDSGPLADFLADDGG